MADRIPVYQSQETVNDARAQDIVLPSIGDGGQIFHDLARTLLREAGPHVQARAEEAAIRDAGTATIVRDPDTGDFVRGNLTHGGGLIYAQAYKKALDAREVTLRQGAFDDEMTKLLVTYRRDPLGFSNAAAGLAEGSLETVPPELRPALEQSFTRDISERTRGLALRVSEENHDGMVRGLSASNDLLRKQIVGIFNASDPSNADDAYVRAAAPLAQLQENITALRGLGLTDEELNAEGLALDVALTDPLRRNAALIQLRNSGQVIGQLDTIDKLQTVLVWGNGTKTDDNFGGFTYDEMFSSLSDPQVRNEFLQTVAMKLANLKEQERAQLAAQPKPETPQEAISRMSFEATGTGTGINVSRETYASTNQQFIDRHGPIGPLLTAPGGRDQVIGFFRQNGYAPIGTIPSLQALANSGDVVGAVELIDNLRQSPTFQGQRTGEQLFDALPPDLKSAVNWVHSVASYRDPSSVNALWLEKGKGGIPGVNDMMARFDGLKGKMRYTDFKRAAMRDALGVDDVGLSATMNVWDQGFDQLVAENMALYDDPQRALAEAANLVKSRLVKSAYFFGGVGDARIFNAGMSPRILDQIFERHPTYSKILPYARWTDTVEAGPEKGRPRLILRRVDREPWATRLGTYMITARDKLGRVQRSFTVNMDDIKALHDSQRKIAVDQQRRAALAAAPEDKWIWGTDPKTGEKRYILNPKWGK